MPYQWMKKKLSIDVLTNKEMTFIYCLLTALFIQPVILLDQSQQFHVANHPIIRCVQIRERPEFSGNATVLFNMHLDLCTV